MSFLKVALIGGVIFLLAKMVDFSALIEDVKHLSKPAIAMFWALWGIALLLLTWRWHVLARAQSVSVRFVRLLEFFFIGLFFNNVIPGSMGGDLVKAYYLARDANRKKEAAVAAVIADRLMGFFSLFSLGFVGIWLNGWSRELRPVLLLFLAIFAVMAGGVVLASRKSLLKRIPFGARILRKIPFERSLSRMYAAFYAYRFHRGALARAFLLSAGLQLWSMGILLFAARSLGIREVAYKHFLLLLPLCSTAFALPVVPGGWATGEIAFVAFFGLLGVPAHKALALDLFLRALNVSWGFLGAVLYLKPQWRVSREEIRQGADEGGAAP